MKVTPLLCLSALLLLAESAHAELLRETWGKKCVHANTLTEIGNGQTARIVFDLSALPKDTQIRRALLRNGKIEQPEEPARIFVVEKLNEKNEPVQGQAALPLLPPRYQWFDATEAVKRWVGDPAGNLGLALGAADGFPGATAFLDIWYEGAAKELPAGVKNLKAEHRDGQTFLTWEELPAYKPPEGSVFWVSFEDRKPKTFDAPGEGYRGKPRVAAIRQKTLRELQKFEVVNPVGKTMSREQPKLVRKGVWPDLNYRIYRSREKITPASIHAADWIGDVRPLCEYDHSMVRTSSWGEYYDPRDDPDAIIPTHCLADGRSLPPGSAFFVNTPQEDGDWYYAVTVNQDGAENFAVVTGENSLEQAMNEKKAPLKPVLQYARICYSTCAYKYFLWDGPPLSSPARAGINTVTVYVDPNYKAPGWLNLSRIVPVNTQDPGHVMLSFDFGNGIGYSEGRQTFRSFRESKLDYYDERTWDRIIDWANEEWKIEPGRRAKADGAYVPPFYAFRHPERIAWLVTQPAGLGYDWVWNPDTCRLRSQLGPRDSATTVDGLPAWNQFHLGWYLQQNPARDFPFYCSTEQQEGPQISFLAIGALRDARQPFASEWGGGGLSRQLRHLLRNLRWDRSIPAFSNCSLDANPGSGWRPDGDPKGQINGFLVWDNQTIAETASSWEMSIGIASDSLRDECTADVTPRYCKSFKPKPGEVFQWSNRDLKTDKELQSGEVTADRWGLVTLKNVKVLKGTRQNDVTKPENRLRIAAVKSN